MWAPAFATYAGCRDSSNASARLAAEVDRAWTKRLEENPGRPPSPVQDNVRLVRSAT